MIHEEEFDVSFLDQSKLKEQEKKVEEGTIACNVDSPEECESCSG